LTCYFKNDAYQLIKGLDKLIKIRIFVVRSRK